MAQTSAETLSQFPDTPQGKQLRWLMEIAAAEDNLKDFWEEGDNVVKEFLGKGPSGSRLNLYYSDVMTKDANLSGVPKVRAKRRYADANDDVARVSAEMLERLLNTDIERDSDGFRRSLQNAKSDWLKPGLGQVRFRYVVETEKRTTEAKLDEAGNELAPAVEEEVKAFEDVETDYVHWRDFLYGPGRTWDEVPWVAFKLEMTRDALKKRFGDDLGGKVSLTKGGGEAKDQREEAVKQAWGRGEVWEIYDKASRTVVWVSKGMEQILDEKPDPLGLPGFFPCPAPLAANLTTSRFVPRATFYLVDKLYATANKLALRIEHLIDMIKVSGAYDSANEGVEGILKAKEGTLVPVKNWASFVANGGTAGAIAFLPIRDMSEVLAQCVMQLAEVKRQIYEITGQSDIMRGMASQKATATEQRIKARFGSSRIQSDQDELARFASDAQRIRAHIIAKQFDPQTIVQRSNIGAAEDPALIEQAVQLLKSDVSQYRIEVDADSLSLTDFDAVRQERTEFLQAMTLYLEQVAKIAPTAPTALPHLLELGKHSLAAFRGAQALETTFDRMIDAAKNPPPPQPPPPDPKMEAEKFKAQADMQRTGMEMQVARAEHQMDMQKLQAEVAADTAKTRNDLARAAAAPQVQPPV